MRSIWHFVKREILISKKMLYVQSRGYAFTQSALAICPYVAHISPDVIQARSDWHLITANSNRWQSLCAC